MFPQSCAISMVEETQPFSLPNNRFVAPTKQVLQRKRSTDAMGRPIDNGDAANSLCRHQFGSPAAGAVGVGK